MFIAWVYIVAVVFVFVGHLHIVILKTGIQGNVIPRFYLYNYDIFSSLTLFHYNSVLKALVIQYYLVANRYYIRIRTELKL